jgi:hypothetical protein
MTLQVTKTRCQFDENVVDEHPISISLPFAAPLKINYKARRVYINYKFVVTILESCQNYQE